MISMDRYIKIVSGVGAGAAARQRELILRIITQNAVLPPGIVVEMTNADVAASYFGSTSEEYARLVKYFAFVSKSITSPRKVSFSRWVATAIPPMIVGDSVAKVLTDWVGVTAGKLRLIVGVDVVDITGIDTSAAADFTAVAAAIQTAIRTSINAQLVSATVTFNTNTNQFVLSGTVTGSGKITATPTGDPDDVSPLLGWTSDGTVFVDGQAADSPADAVRKSAAISDNFGSFLYVTPTVAFTNDQIADISEWNHAQNNKFLFCTPVLQSNAQTLYNLIKGFSGTAQTLLSTTQANDYAEQMPAEILAATNYDRVNATQNYMYYQFGNRNITVSDDATADFCDANRVNYNGVTQSAGQQLAFYQRGVLTGDSTAATDMNTYANEMWMKAYITAQLMTMLLAMPEVPADETGRPIVLSVLQGAADRGKTNGVISKGKTLSEIQKQYISQVSGDPKAWQQVSTIGYWLDVTFRSEVTIDSRTEWYADYLFIYAKKDNIRSVRGSDILI